MHIRPMLRNAVQTHLLPILHSLGRALVGGKAMTQNLRVNLRGTYIGIPPATFEQYDCHGSAARIDFQWRTDIVRSQIEASTQTSTSRGLVSWVKRLIGKDLFLAAASPFAELYRTRHYGLNANTI